MPLSSTESNSTRRRDLIPRNLGEVCGNGEPLQPELEPVSFLVGVKRVGSPAKTSWTTSCVSSSDARNR